ncbi:Oidioi.mRNA.OKI2018_I69.XSR.g15516.t3.cds [Oikopleura dioica]|uniref:Oidioi.mRNA.OKI2018_I69.XSR.g15516.t3.cds n=1 Tax=Oikopleura dioica TaxID=34765 RepID=A0ABN7SH39_OIKDI|nr:Oidioi.mRNA.OKI2018_I69.XSR.g15516.t3.cds [Oikopleura dioica]
MPSTVKPTDGSQVAVSPVEEVANGLERVNIADKAAENGQSNGTSAHVENGKESNGSGSSDHENQRPTESAPKKERGKRRNRQVLDITLPAYQSVRSQSDGHLRDRRRRNRIDVENLEPTEKLFVGGLPINFPGEELGEHFSQFGTVVEALTKEGRTFGFVTFASIEEAEKALEVKIHKIADREVEVKRAIAANNRSHNMPVMPMDTSYGMMEPCASQGSCSSTSPTGSQFHNGTNYPNSHPDYEIDGQQQKKLFIGGLHWRTEDDDLRNYFQAFGQLTDAMVIKCPEKQKSRGFGFVVYASPEDAETVLHHPVHQINEKVVDVKRAVSRDLIGRLKSDTYSENNSNNLVKSKKGQDIVDEAGRHRPVDKVFVGGIAAETTRKEVKDYFEEKFEGCKVKNMDMKVDEDTGSHQSYAFITFADTDKAKAIDVVESICQSKYQRIGSHLCEVKKAHSKNARFIKNAEKKHQRERECTPANCVYSTDYTPYPMYSPIYSMYPYPMPVPVDQHGLPIGADDQSTGHYEYNGVWYPNTNLEEDNEIKEESSKKKSEESNNNGGYASPAEFSPYGYPSYYPNCGTYVPASYSPYGNFYMAPQHVSEH